MNNNWNTRFAHLSFIAGEDNLHEFFLTGTDYGQTCFGYRDNFSWGTMDITDNFITLYDGNDEVGGALYLREIIGAEILGDTVMNIIGSEGLTIYYKSHLSGNRYLGGLNYTLKGGGYLVAAVPEPSTMLLLCAGLIGLAGWGRKKCRKR